MDTSTEVTRWDGRTYRGISIALSMARAGTTEHLNMLFFGKYAFGGVSPYYLLEITTFSYSHSCTLANGAVFKCDCPVARQKFLLVATAHGYISGGTKTIDDCGWKKRTIIIFIPSPEYVDFVNTVRAGFAWQRALVSELLQTFQRANSTDTLSLQPCMAKRTRKSTQVLVLCSACWPLTPVYDLNASRRTFFAVWPLDASSHMCEKYFFLRLVWSYEPTCESVWPPFVNPYASPGFANLRSLASTCESVAWPGVWVYVTLKDFHNIMFCNVHRFCRTVWVGVVSVSSSMRGKKLEGSENEIDTPLRGSAEKARFCWQTRYTSSNHGNKMRFLHNA